MSPLVLRPRRLVLVCWAVAVLVVVAFSVLAYVLPNGATAAAPVRRSDQVAFFLLGCLIAAVPVAFTRARVRADERGVWIRNGLGERFLPWQVVVAVRLDLGAPWATLELQDDESKALLAVQANDGERAVEAVLALRALLDASRRGS
jgi:membrane protease YdiL (CAAX protease family)